jgi:hypothetical protein
MTLLLDEAGAVRLWTEALYQVRRFELDLARQLCDGRVDVCRDVLWEGSPRPWLIDACVHTVFGPMHTWDAIRTIERSTRAAAAMSATNYQDASAILGPSPPVWTGLRGHTRAFSRRVTTDHSGWQWDRFDHSMRRRFVAVALAIRLYELDHGARPPTLDELVPDYLDAVPRDPFAHADRPIGYRRDGPRPFL